MSSTTDVPSAGCMFRATAQPALTLFLTRRAVPPPDIPSAVGNRRVPLILRGHRRRA